MIDELLFQLKQEIEALPLEEKIEALNKVREELHTISPFREEPVDCVLWVKAESLHANEYNPNVVANPEMKLLYTSIKLDGYTQPIVSYQLDGGMREIVDGFHRRLVEKKEKDISKRIFGYLPVTTINKPLSERMGSTIRHNRARGTHEISAMSDIILDLAKSGWSDDDICKKLGMELDEVIRLKQITGLKEAFQNHEFSKSWEEFESKYYKQSEAETENTFSK